MAFSGNRNGITNAYRFSLGIGELKGINYDNLKVYITDSNFYATNHNRIKGIYWSSASDSELNKDYNKLRLGDLQDTYKFYTDKDRKQLKGLSSMIIDTNLRLSNTLQDSFNKDTGETSEAYYENMVQIPASAKIFTRNSHNNSWICNDLDWDPDATGNSATMQYFKTEYNFNTKFNKTEYQSYGLNLNKLEENVCRLSATSFMLNSKLTEQNKNVMDYGAAGILLTYEDEEKGFIGQNELPVAFYDFGKTLHSNYNFLQIDWHEDGVIKVE